MVYSLKEEIIRILKKEGACSRSEIAKNLKSKPNRAILMGYLRALVDLNIISSKDIGKAKLYFLHSNNSSKGGKN